MMGDKANTKHGNMVTLPYFSAIVYSTSSDYSSNDSGVAYVVPYVIFANA